MYERGDRALFIAISDLNLLPAAGMLERHVRELVDLAKRRPSFLATESKSLTPSDAEVALNPRANSALLHCETRSVHPPLEIPDLLF